MKELQLKDHNLNFGKLISSIVFVIMIFWVSLFFCSCSCSSQGRNSEWDFDFSQLKTGKDTSQIIIVAPDKEDSSYADLLFAQKTITNAQPAESTEEKIVTKEEAEIGKVIKSKEEGTTADEAKKQDEAEEDPESSESQTNKSDLYDPSNVEYKWSIVVKCKVRIGRDGIVTDSVDDNKSPRGVFGIKQAFGSEVNPGTLIDYTNIDDSYYWVRDTRSTNYNKLVSINNVKKDWNDAVNLAESGQKYKYAFVLDYNINNNDRNKASGIFFECGGSEATDGAISLSEDDLKKLLVFASPNCKVIIDAKDNLFQY